MALSEVFSWRRTTTALEALESLLRCSGCGAIASEPRRYGRCAHVFCGPCADGSGTCAACAVPSEAREQRSDTTLRAVAAGCVELRRLLGLTSDQDREEQPQGAARTGREQLETRQHREDGAAEEDEQRKNACGGLQRKAEAPREGGDDTSRQVDKLTPEDRGSAAAAPPTLGDKKAAVKDNRSKRQAQKTSGKRPEDPPVSKKSRSPPPPTASAAAGGRRTQSSGASSLASAASLTKRNAKGETRLHAACVQGDTERVQALLAAGASPNTQDHAGWTPLHEACEAGRAALAATLLDAGAVPDPPGLQLRTPLHEAVAAGRAEMAALLVRRGADPEARCLFGTTPRQLAAGRPDMLAALDTAVEADGTLSPPDAPTEPARAVVLAAAELPAASVTALKKTAAKLGWKFAAAVSEATTHLVCGEPAAGVSVPRMRALLVGAWLVTPDWTAACAEAGHTLPAEPWHVAGEAGVRACRRRRRLQPPLLTGLHVYLQGVFRRPARAELAALLQLAGGRVLSRSPNPESVPAGERTVPYHAPAGSPLRHTSHLVVFEEPPAIQYDMRHVKSLPLAWLLLSLETHTLADPIR